jgi:hypothetical protein
MQIGGQFHAITHLVLNVLFQLHRQESGQVSELLIAVKRQPFAHDIGVDAVTLRDTGNRGARLQAFLDDLGFEGLWIRVLAPTPN